MNSKGHRSTIFAGRIPGWIPVMVCLATTFGVSLGDVTLEINVGPVAAPAGTIGILVADREGDGFVELNGAHGLITNLVVGETLGWSDDVIVAVIEADSEAHWNGESGFGDLAGEIDYESFGVEEGDTLSLFWFPDHRQTGAQLQAGDSYRRFRADSVSNSGGTIGFILPADGEVQTIAHLAPSVGGNSDPEDPITGAESESGEVGLFVTELPNGERQERVLAPNGVDYFWIDVVETGGIKIAAEGLDGLITTLMGSDGVEVEIATGSGGEITQLVSGVEPGRYFLAVEGDSFRVKGRYSLESESGVLRPDLAIQKPGTSRFLGIRKYSLTGAGQTVTAKTERGKKVAFATEGVNRGTLPDGIFFTGNRSNRYFAVRYFRVKPGRKNITAAVARGYEVTGLEPLKKVSVNMEVNPKGRGKRKGAAKRFKGTLAVQSGFLSEIKDRVRANLIAK